MGERMPPIRQCMPPSKTSMLEMGYLDESWSKGSHGHLPPKYHRPLLRLLATFHIVNGKTPLTYAI